MKLTDQIVGRALEAGASLAGFVDTVSLGEAPSYRPRSKVGFPAAARSVLVLALAHRESEPELDWWGVPGGTAGNRQLQAISQALAQWLEADLGIHAQPIPYQIERAGIFLKDAAVLAGLGVLGRNNLLITPEFGPRVRLRGLFLEAEAATLAMHGFSPCDSCSMPCRRDCPRDAFACGSYGRAECEIQMSEDESHRAAGAGSMLQEAATSLVRYCRVCELRCPVGG